MELDRELAVATDFNGAIHDRIMALMTERS